MDCPENGIIFGTAMAEKRLENGKVRYSAAYPTGVGATDLSRGKCEEREMANVITCGTFDLFHVGQLRLQRARSVVRKGLLYHGGCPHIICHGIQ